MSSEEVKTKTGATHRPYDEAFKRAAVAQWQSGVPARRAGEVVGQNTLSAYLTKVAQLGGYLARRRDPPPGNLVMWRGMRRLADLMFGVQIGVEFMGN